MWLARFDRTRLPTAEEALPGRDQPMPVTEPHRIFRVALMPPFPPGTETVLFGMGCFWGAERCFWTLPGVWVTAVGYAGGLTPNPDYDEVCSGRTGHNEVVMVVHDPVALPFEQLLQVFWEGHDPTQGMRQGNDIGTQYRSGIYCTTEAQRRAAEASRDRYQAALQAHGHGPITTEILPAPTFYYAESWHQQYLDRNPGGYCGLGGDRCRLSAGPLLIHACRHAMGTVQGWNAREHANADVPVRVWFWGNRWPAFGRMAIPWAACAGIAVWTMAPAAVAGG